MNLEAPHYLPNGIQHLSHSAVDTYLRCPEKWRRRYIDREYEPRAGHLVLGAAVHSAEIDSYQDKIKTGEAHALEQVLDDYSTSLDNEISSTRSEIDWGETTQAKSKDRGARMLAEYHAFVPERIKPISVENEFNIRLHPDYKWTIKGYVDLIGDIDNGIIVTKNAAQDMKTVSRAINQDDLENSTQATLYTYSQMLQNAQLYGMPFVVHELKALKTVQSARILETYRTREQGERYMERVAQVAREIDWRMSSGDWQGAPPNAWWCRPKMCGYYATCKFAAGRP